MFFSFFVVLVIGTALVLMEGVVSQYTRPALGRVMTTGQDATTRVVLSMGGALPEAGSLLGVLSLIICYP